MKIEITPSTSRQRRIKDIRERAHTANSVYGYCRIKGCQKPARAGTDKGLDKRYCLKHAEHRRRHGSPWKPSYSSARLKPYRVSALKWLKRHGEEPAVRNVLSEIHMLYWKAGKVVPAYNLRGLKPEQRAWIAIARLREARIPPVRVVAACMAVLLAIENDPQPEFIHAEEYRLVQLAKAVHRLASGTHKRWSSTRETFWNGLRRTETHVQRLDVYPHSKGQILRHLGQKLDNILRPLSSYNSLNSIKAV